MVREVLNRLPDKVVTSLNIWKDHYSDSRFDTDIARAEIRGYLKGLRDSGVIKNDTEYKCLFCYCTV